MKITATAESLLHGFRMLSLPNGNEPLFNPLNLTVEPGKVTNVVQSANKGAFMSGEITNWQVEKTKQSEEGQRAVIDSEELLKYLGIFESKDVVTIELDETVTLKSARKKAVIYPEALEPTVPPSLPQVKEGKVYYKGGTVEAKTRAVVPKEAFKEFVTDSRVVFGAQKPIFPIEFDPSGTIVAALGSTQAKHNIVETKIETKVEGEKATARFGPDFINLFQNIEAPCEIQMTAGLPMVVIVGSLMYVIAPLREV